MVLAATLSLERAYRYRAVPKGVESVVSGVSRSCRSLTQVRCGSVWVWVPSFGMDGFRLTARRMPQGRRRQVRTVGLCHTRPDLTSLLPYSRRAGLGPDPPCQTADCEFRGPPQGVTGVTGVAPLMAKPSSTISGALPGKNMWAPCESL